MLYPCFGVKQISFHHFHPNLKIQKQTKKKTRTYVPFCDRLTDSWKKLEDEFAVNISPKLLSTTSML